jgi:hypothetical protein
LPAALKVQEAGQVPECTQAPEELEQMLRFFVQERGADFLMTAKGNQPGVAEAARTLFEQSPHAFFSGTSGRGDSAL